MLGRVTYWVLLVTLVLTGVIPLQTHAHSPSHFPSQPDLRSLLLEGRTAPAFHYDPTSGSAFIVQETGSVSTAQPRPEHPAPRDLQRTADSEGRPLFTSGASPCEASIAWRITTIPPAQAHDLLHCTHIDISLSHWTKVRVWLSPDPLGFVDGPNLYAYVRNNPWSAWDPFGLESAIIGKVYIVINDITKEIYVGETSRELKDRLNYRKNGKFAHPARQLLEKKGTRVFYREIRVDSSWADIADEQGLTRLEAMNYSKRAAEDAELHEKRGFFSKQGYTFLNNKRAETNRSNAAHWRAMFTVRRGAKINEQEFKLSLWRRQFVPTRTSRVPSGRMIGFAAGSAAVGSVLLLANADASAEDVNVAMYEYFDAIESGKTGDAAFLGLVTNLATTLAGDTAAVAPIQRKLLEMAGEHSGDIAEDFEALVDWSSQ